MCAFFPSQAELKNLIDISSCSFEFAKELIRHNLVSSSQGLSVSVKVYAYTGGLHAKFRHSESLPCVLQVVFRGGEGALQVLPPLIDVIPEARLNLVIYYLRQGVYGCGITVVCNKQKKEEIFI